MEAIGLSRYSVLQPNLYHLQYSGKYPKIVRWGNWFTVWNGAKCLWSLPLSVQDTWMLLLNIYLQVELKQCLPSWSVRFNCYPFAKMAVRWMTCFLELRTVRCRLLWFSGCSSSRWGWSPLTFTSFKCMFPIFGMFMLNTCFTCPLNWNVQGKLTNTGQPVVPIVISSSMLSAS